MYKKILKFSMAAAALLVLSGCGGGSGGSASDGSGATVTRTTGVGYYTDAAVSGVEYICGEENGITDKEGRFEFEKGKGCTFRIGDVVLRTVEPSKLEDGVVVFENDVNVAAFLQSLDADGDPSNGIEVKKEVAEALEAAGVTRVPASWPEREKAIEALEEKIDTQLRAVNDIEAKEHLEASLAEVKRKYGGRVVPMVEEDGQKSAFDNEKEEAQSSSGGVPVAEEQPSEGVDHVMGTPATGNDEVVVDDGQSESFDDAAVSEAEEPSDGTGPIMGAPSGGNEETGDTNDETTAGNGEEETATPVKDAPIVVTGGLAQIDDAVFNDLEEEEQYAVARKLYSTIYKGVPYAQLRSEIGSGSFISKFQAKLSANVATPDLSQMETYIPYDASLKYNDYQYDRTERYAGNIKQEIYSRLYYIPMGRHYFNEWIAYVLTQTILFSPAREVDSVDPFPQFIRNVYYRLVDGLDAGKSVQQITYEHMISTENWGRFRSPEDNGREMLEIWLRNFEDEPVPEAAKALKNWRFENHYEPSVGQQVYKFYRDEPGAVIDEPVELFGKRLNNGYEFFRAVVEHPDFMPTVVGRLVDYFFPTFSDAEKKEVERQIVASDPKSFQEIFAQILFSKKYLFESDKVKSVEEIFYSLAQSLPWHMTKAVWSWAWASNIKGISAAMDLANQRSMWNKLGRDNKLPTDTLSINYYHQYVRSGILLAQCDNPESEYQEGIVFGWLDARLDHGSIESFLDGIFLEVLGRHVKEIEKETLARIVKEQGWDEKFADWPWQRAKTAKLALDYMSRLSEMYRYQRIEGGAK